MAEEVRQRYGLDKSMPERYISWIVNFVKGDFGQSFRYEVDVNELIWDRIGFTLLTVSYTHLTLPTIYSV